MVQLSLLAVFTLLGITALTSCQKGGCTVEQSDNYDPEAKKDDGSCIPWRNKFIGTYAVTETCTGDTPVSFTLVISASSTSETGLIFTNPSGFTFFGNVTARTMLTIPNQQVNVDGDAFNLSGSGTIDDNALLRLTYTISFGILSTNCVSEGNKL